MYVCCCILHGAHLWLHLPGSFILVAAQISSVLITEQHLADHDTVFTEASAASSSLILGLHAACALTAHLWPG